MTDMSVWIYILEKNSHNIYMGSVLAVALMVDEIEKSKGRRGGFYKMKNNDVKTARYRKLKKYKES